MEWRQMEFCTQCGSRLKPTKVHLGNQAMIVLVCTKCGQKKPKTEGNPKVDGIFVEHSPKQLVAVIGKAEQELTTMPTIRMECPRCGNNTANIWQVQTRGFDEASTQFVRCIRCGFTYREYT